MIVYNNAANTVKTNSVLYGNPEAVRNLAVMMLVNAAEFNMDMVMDMPHEYASKPEIEAAFLHLNELALESLDDHIDTLRGALKAELERIKFRARVTRLDYSKSNGELSDIHVEINVE